LVQLPGWQQADEETRIVLSFALLTHDFGKAESTHKTLKDGELRIVSPGHEEASVPLAESFLTRFRTPQAIVERVLPLTRHHMAHMNEVTDRAVRRLAKRLEPENIEHLCTVMTADAFGRPPRPPEIPHVVSALLAKAAELQVHSSAPKAILLGRHLVELGMQPGPEMGAILKKAYDGQLEGKFFNLSQAMEWLAGEFSTQSPELEARARATVVALERGA
jgi:tRNA nucleotidyltransferase (CCA-adding enzyme)